jgi:hypothetical protein
MAVTMVSGNDGRVRIGTTIVATVKSWKLNKTTTPVPVPNFESPTQEGDTATLVYPEVLGGLSQATITLEGQFNIDLSDATDTIGISNGEFADLDLYLSKAVPYGFDDVPVMFTAFNPSTTIDNQAASFTAEAVSNGVVPFSGTIT